jgi:hypothetical protein
MTVMTASPFPFLFLFSCSLLLCFFFLLTFALYKGIRDTKRRMTLSPVRKSMKASG